MLHLLINCFLLITHLFVYNEIAIGQIKWKKKSTGIIFVDNRQRTGMNLNILPSFNMLSQVHYVKYPNLHDLGMTFSKKKKRRNIQLSSVTLPKQLHEFEPLPLMTWSYLYSPQTRLLICYHVKVAGSYRPRHGI